MSGFVKTLGIILMLFGCGVATYGLIVTTGAAGESLQSVEQSTNQGAAFLGMTIGASISTAVFGCVALGVFVVGAVFFFIGRSGQNRQRDLEDMERRHQEQLAAMGGEKPKVDG